MLITLLVVNSVALILGAAVIEGLRMIRAH
jgi:hypothetical protein